MDENKELTLNLKIKDWNRIRASMGKIPYEQINDLFREMDRQFDEQLKLQTSEPLSEKIKEEENNGQEK